MSSTRIPSLHLWALLLFFSLRVTLGAQKTSNSVMRAATSTRQTTSLGEPTEDNHAVLSQHEPVEPALIQPSQQEHVHPKAVARREPTDEGIISHEGSVHLNGRPLHQRKRDQLARRQNNKLMSVVEVSAMGNPRVLDKQEELFEQASSVTTFSPSDTTTVTEPPAPSPSPAVVVVPPPGLMESMQAPGVTTASPVTVPPVVSSPTPAIVTVAPAAAAAAAGSLPATAAPASSATAAPLVATAAPASSVTVAPTVAPTAAPVSATQAPATSQDAGSLVHFLMMVILVSIGIFSVIFVVEYLRRQRVRQGVFRQLGGPGVAPPRSAARNFASGLDSTSEEAGTPPKSPRGIQGNSTKSDADRNRQGTMDRAASPRGDKGGGNGHGGMAMGHQESYRDRRRHQNLKMGAARSESARSSVVHEGADEDGEGDLVVTSTETHGSQGFPFAVAGTSSHGHLSVPVAKAKYNPLDRLEKSSD